MLRRVSLEDFVIVETAELEFGPGLAVLSGETGAGKSILVDALGFASGGRGASEWVRPGADQLTVEAEFELPSDGGGETLRAAFLSHGAHPDEAGRLVVRRELKRDGRSRAFVNGRVALVSDLRAICRHLVRIVSQGDTRLLEDQSALEELLDRRAGNGRLRTEWARRRRVWIDGRRELASLVEEDATFRVEEDWLRFQLREIEEAGVRVGEREELAAALQTRRLREDDAALRAELRARLSDDEGSVLDHLETLLHHLRRSGSPVYDEIQTELEVCRERIRGLLRHIRTDADTDELDPSVVEERLRALDRLTKKHGGDEVAVLEHAARIRERVERAESVARRLEEARVRHQRAGRELGDHGAELSLARRAASSILTAQVAEILSTLGMPGAAIEFEFRRAHALPDAPEVVPAGDGYAEVGEGGIDQVSLRFRSHPSMSFGPLGRVASGGELSRVLLAIESSSASERAAESAGRPVWVFDEIDAGVGGETALKVADRLAHLAKDAQVLLVTHQAAIAARAGTHYRVVKEEEDARLPRAFAERIDGEPRLAELARMLSGDEQSKIARRHARALMDSARA